jgi:hypothetical protein
LRWYIPPAPFGLGPGVAFSGSLQDGIDRHLLGASSEPFPSAVFFQGAQWLIAGWSSPVARQAHNLKVIGSNPIPATKSMKNPSNLKGLLGFCFGDGINRSNVINLLVGSNHPATTHIFSRAKISRQQEAFVASRCAIREIFSWRLL